MTAGPNTPKGQFFGSMEYDHNLSLSSDMQHHRSPDRRSKLSTMKDTLGCILEKKRGLKSDEAKKLARDTRASLKVNDSIVWTPELEKEAFRLHDEQTRKHKAVTPRQLNFMIGAFGLGSRGVKKVEGAETKVESKTTKPCDASKVVSRCSQKQLESNSIYIENEPQESVVDSSSTARPTQPPQSEQENTTNKLEGSSKVPVNVSPRRRPKKLPISPRKEVEPNFLTFKRNKTTEMEPEDVFSDEITRFLISFDDDLEPQTTISNNEAPSMVPSIIPSTRSNTNCAPESQSKSNAINSENCSSGINSKLPSMFPPLRSTSHCTVDSLFAGVNNNKVEKWSGLRNSSPTPLKDTPQESVEPLSPNLRDSSPKRPIRRKSVDSDIELFGLPFHEISYESEDTCSSPRRAGRRRIVVV
jgi:hypothetical protein